MQRISIELVPRDRETIEGQLKMVVENFPLVSGVNFPDLLKYDLRSWDCCRISKNYYHYSIPHLRAMDFNPAESFVLVPHLREMDVREVLVITGDPPQEMNKRVYPATSLDLIRKIKKEMPEMKVYAAIDPYRNSIHGELETIRRKRDAGADGFFTQPFFDLRMIEIYGEFLRDQVVFWGISPITSEKSLYYWETKNNVVFPAGFRPTLEWNTEFARKALAYIKSIGHHIYFMPIRIELKTYLQGVFSEE